MWLFFAFVFLAKGAEALKTPLTPISWSILHMLSSMYFIDSGQTSKYLIHFELKFVHGVM